MASQSVTMLALMNHRLAFFLQNCHIDRSETFEIVVNEGFT